MEEIKTIELDERTKEWIEGFCKLQEYLYSKLGMTKEQLGEPYERRNNFNTRRLET
jgi:hypothetical protein